VGICTICRYIKYLLEPKFEMIKVKIDGKRTSFSIKDIAGVKVESFINPVTREEQDTKIQLPNEFIGKIAEAAKT
jgi:hypothetical protein